MRAGPFILICLALTAPLRAVCDLDAGFGGSGYRSFSSPSGGSGAVGSDLLVLSDGRLLVAGTGTSSGGDRNAAWWAFDSAGNLTASAGYDGLVSAGMDEEFFAAAQAPGNGPVYLAGYALDGAGNTSVVLARLNFPALTLDSGFGNAWGYAGLVTWPAGSAARGVAVDAAGRAYTLSGGSLVRWTCSGANAGTIDATFGGSSGFQFDAAAEGQDLRLDSAGRLVVAGAVPGGIALWRVLSSAGMDGSFGSGGKSSLAVASVAGLNALTVGSGDGLLATGYAYEPLSFKSHWIAYRVNGSGTPVAGFGSAGLAQGADQTNIAAFESGSGSLVNADGGLLVTGQTPSGFLPLAGFWRLLSGGGLDASSGASQRTVAGQPGSICRPREAGALAYATGYLGSDMALWRFAACGGGSGPVIVPGGTTASVATAFPSPARDHVTFAFQLDQACDVRLEVYDERGVRLSSESRPFNAGPANWRLDLSGYAPGVYLYRLKPSVGSAPDVGKFAVRP